MHSHKHLNMLVLLVCALQLACAPTGKKYSNQAPAARGGVMPIDNDSYYSQPGSYIPGGAMYNGCNQINDAPSCGGG